MRKFIIAGLLGLALVTTKVVADEFIISGNAAGSDNSIEVNSSQQTTVTQSNQVDVTNDVDASANTGGNSTDNGSVQTGDASVIVKIKNFFNWNQADVDTCCPEGVTPTPIQSGPTPTVYDPGKPTPTPTTPPGVGGPTNGGDGGNGDGGGNGGGGGGVGGPSGEVLGLSAASGEGTVQMALTALGLLCLAVGGALVRHPKHILA